jgi:hypothetical protein
MPQVDSALRSFYRKNAKETVEISLESIGESPLRTQPTVLVICTSVNKVRHILKRKLGALFDGPSGFALKVCQGRVVRSRNTGVERSMAKAGEGPDGKDEITAANGEYQERPQPGASIGAWIGDRHLPPVSFGGLVIIDDKPYGMTVHHMLDDPEMVQREAGGDASQGNERSMAGDGLIDLAAWYAGSHVDADSSDSDDFACEFDSESNDALSESAITSDYESEISDDDDGQEEEYAEAGDIPGIEPGCGDGYIVTQPALDDVPDSFYPSADTANDDHLSSYSLGDVYASSGIRRKSDAHGLVHEIDWALFEFNDDRMPTDNEMPRARCCSPATTPTGHSRKTGGIDVLHPMSVATTSQLAGLEVQCIARTSGLQTGLILPALTSVKIYGRTSPSHTYQVTAAPGLKGRTNLSAEPASDPNKSMPRLPMGIPGDSGAWIIGRDRGQLCGHVLAWSQRKRVAYICPMEMLLHDILDTLGARQVRLPGSAAVVSTLRSQKTLAPPSKHGEPAQGEADDDEGLGNDADHEWEDERLVGPTPTAAGTQFGRPLPRYSEHDESPEPSPPVMGISRESTFSGEADDNVSVVTETELPTYESKGAEKGDVEDVEIVRDMKRVQLSGNREPVGNREVGVP